MFARGVMYQFPIKSTMAFDALPLKISSHVSCHFNLESNKMLFSLSLLFFLDEFNAQRNKWMRTEVFE